MDNFLRHDLASDEHPRIVDTANFGAHLLQGHTDMVLVCDVSSDGAWVATGSKDHTLRLWSTTPPCRCFCVFTGHVSPITAVALPKKRPRQRGSRSTALGPPPTLAWMLSGGQEPEFVPRNGTHDGEQCIRGTIVDGGGDGSLSRADPPPFGFNVTSGGFSDGNERFASNRVHVVIVVVVSSRILGHLGKW